MEITIIVMIDCEWDDKEWLFMNSKGSMIVVSKDVTLVQLTDNLHKKPQVSKESDSFKLEVRYKLATPWFSAAEIDGDEDLKTFISKYSHGVSYRTYFITRPCVSPLTKKIPLLFTVVTNTSYFKRSESPISLQPDVATDSNQISGNNPDFMCASDRWNVQVFSLGRTARAGREGYAVTFITDNDRSLLKAIADIQSSGWKTSACRTLSPEGIELHFDKAVGNKDTTTSVQQPRPPREYGIIQERLAISKRKKEKLADERKGGRCGCGLSRQRWRTLKLPTQGSKEEARGDVQRSLQYENRSSQELYGVLFIE
ncbi:DEAD-box ATP-dependent RNA helicase 28 [Artemisia annua]|uniref:DEAD-box ATP-dependent RNA helicase 28 n=1 Tax=Artemisia annua TaxID=35608 RepID=A0A2U1NBH5_ARTAN|nr:DEAD-box ATP-dependent RNA helicase 28 [Artemisia annua]